MIKFGVQVNSGNTYPRSIPEL